MHILACCALLFVQLAGVHLHAGSSAHAGHVGHDGYGVHLDQDLSSHHADDHEHTEVSLYEPAPLKFSKYDLYVVLPQPVRLVPPALWYSHDVATGPPVAAAGARYSRPSSRAPPAAV